MVMNLQSRLLHKLGSARNLGFVPSCVYAFQKLRQSQIRGKSPFRLYTRYAKYPLQCRANTSDAKVFSQIFAGREYRCLDEVRDASLIIDCGANVGYSAAYFLTRYPRAEVIAVEPDPENFATMQANVAAYGPRCRTVCSGIWSHRAGLVLSDEQLGDGLEWARTVRPAAPGQVATMQAVDIGGLLAESGHERISILKIDIEGSEAAVFSSNYEEWLDRVDNLVIELHGPRCKAIFADAIKGAGFVTSQCDELTVCKRA
jgi:FkbM family methyltransferase